MSSMAASCFFPLARSRLSERSRLPLQRSWASLWTPASASSLASSPSPSIQSPSFATLASSKNDVPSNHNGNIETMQSGNNTISTSKTKEFSANADPSEVNKFSSFASHWWDSRANPLVGMNPIRIKFMRQVVEDLQSSHKSANENVHLPLHEKRILDIGCGGGLLTESLSRLGASLVVGVDASPKVVDVAKMHSFHENSRLNSEQLDTEIINPENGNIRYIGGMTVEELASQWLSEREKEQTTTQQPNQVHNHELFDIITALEVIEHVPNPTSLIHAAKKLLKPNGILFVSTINRTMKSYGVAIVGAEYITGKVPVGTHDWNQFWSPAEVERMVCSGSGAPDNNAPMKQMALSGMVIEPPFVNMQWCLDPLDVDVNWIGAYQKKTTM